MSIQKILSEHLAFRWMLRADVVIAIALGLLLSATAVKRQLVISRGFYVSASALAILAGLAFSGVGAHAFRRPEGPLTASPLLFITVLIPSILLVEAGLTGSVGTQGWWKVPFLGITALGTFFLSDLVRSSSKFSSSILLFARFSCTMSFE
jgi:hypothetical protein